MLYLLKHKKVDLQILTVYKINNKTSMPDNYFS